MASIINASSTGSGGIVQTADASGVLQLQNNGTAVLTVSGNNVGIGTASPSLALSVVGQVLSGPTGGNAFVLNSSGANYGFISNPSSGNFALGYGTTPATLGTTALNWNSSGQITIPSQPLAVARLTGSGSVTPVSGITQIQLNATDINTSSSFNTSTYTFTTPVTGRYLISGVLTFNSATTSSYSGLLIYKNGGILVSTYQYHLANTYCQVSSTYIAQLSAGDTIAMYTDNQAGNNSYEQARTWLNILLIG
jgi:hypothetical protein